AARRDTTMRRAPLIGLLVTLFATPAFAHPNHPQHVLVYLNGDGATLTGGWDDSRKNVSSLLAQNGLDSMEVPPYSGGARRWSQIVQCVKDEYAAFDVDITDQRPASGDYVMMMVGGKAGSLGYPRNVTGMTPYNGKVIPRAIGMV